MKKIFLFFLLMSFVLTSTAQAGIFIYEPENNAKVFEPIVMLKGVAKNVSSFSINGQPIPLDPKGGFSCGLILAMGKNLVSISAINESGGREQHELRLQRLKTFPDIEEYFKGKKHWARGEIIKLATLGFIEGYPDDSFYPGNPITRGELATWLAKVKGLPIPKLDRDVFLDVPKEHWRAPSVKAVVEASFMGGYDNQSFGLDDPISRREAAEIAVISEGTQGAQKIIPLFVDVPKEERGAFPIYVARQRGLVKGVPGNLPIFEPDRALTRAEGAVILSRFKRANELVTRLDDFSQGYTADKLCSINVQPKISFFTAVPTTITKGQENVLAFRVALVPREAFAPISKVKIDLRPLGGLSNIEMYDSGESGDEIAADFVYSLNASLKPLESGSFRIKASVVDKLGWESEREISVLVVD
ncbi:MAG: S-layer homology domain-containing protein [bacterium]|nr:S-layer homology domain-containing protein [Candidatus Margulisiibacteriota bacterium]